MSLGTATIISILGALLLAALGRPDQAPVVTALLELAKAGMTSVVLTLGVRLAAE